MDTIDHVAVVVEDIDKAVEWYTTQFKCEVEWHDTSWAFLKFANCGLALVRPGEHPNHFAILTNEIDKFGQAVAHRDGTRSIYKSDPDGNTYELLERPAEH